MITRISTKDMPHEEWLERRKHTIGGSDAASVIGLNPFSSPYALWAEKTGRVAGFEGNLATEVGTYLEEFVAQKFAAETGKKVRNDNAFIYNDKYPWAHANVDRVVCGESAILEIKTTSELNLKKFKGGEYPANYYCQAVHYLGLTEKERCYLAVLIGNKEFRWFVIERDEAEIAALMAAEKDFWQLVQNNTPPVADGLQATSETLTTIYAKSDDSCVDLFGFDSDLDRYMNLCDQIKALQEQKDEAANKIKSYMGEAGRGECDRYKVSWSSSARQIFDAKRFAEDHPDMDLSDYYNISNTRSFRVSKQKGA